MSKHSANRSPADWAGSRLSDQPRACPAVGSADSFGLLYFGGSRSSAVPALPNRKLLELRLCHAACHVPTGMLLSKPITVPPLHVLMALLVLALSIWGRVGPGPLRTAAERRPVGSSFSRNDRESSGDALFIVLLALAVAAFVGAEILRAQGRHQFASRGFEDAPRLAIIVSYFYEIDRQNSSSARTTTMTDPWKGGTTIWTTRTYPRGPHPGSITLPSG